jgi:hypothetical protein
MSVLNIFKKSDDANLGQTLVRLARWAQASHQHQHQHQDAAGEQAQLDESDWDEAAWNDETVFDATPLQGDASDAPSTSRQATLHDVTESRR